MPTARNARGVDIIAYNFNCTKMVGIQVKSLSKRNPVPLGNSLDKIMADFWIIVNNLSTDTPSTYVLTPKEVKKSAHRGEKDGRISYWLQPKEYAKEIYKDSWNRIGNPNE